MPESKSGDLPLVDAPRKIQGKFGGWWIADGLINVKVLPPGGEAQSWEGIPPLGGLSEAAALGLAEAPPAAATRSAS